MPKRKQRTTILPATRTNRHESSTGPVTRINGNNTTTRIINHDTQLFPPRKPKSNPPKRPTKTTPTPAKTTSKKPKQLRPFIGYDKKGKPKQIGLKKNKLDLKG